MNTKKNKAAISLGRKGGKARVSKLTPEQISAEMQERARQRWANLTPEQRSERMERVRAARGAKEV